MSHITTQQLLNAHQLATAAWSQPSKLFTSGHDARTSDNSLLNLFYGGLVHAHQFNWQNAGRRLIDKTYIQMLLVSQGLSCLSFRQDLDDRNGKILVVWGAEDQVIPASHANSLKNARVEVLDSAGHMVQMEKASMVNELIPGHITD